MKASRKKGIAEPTAPEPARASAKRQRELRVGYYPPPACFKCGRAMRGGFNPSTIEWKGELYQTKLPQIERRINSWIGPLSFSSL
jgi:hypothetical protein